MTGFISRIITRHSYPQNNVIPRLPGKYESKAGVTQNTFENDFGTSDIGSIDNPEDVGNNRFIRHTQHNAHDSIAPAAENDSEALPDKSKPSTAKPSNATFQTPFIAKPIADIDKHEVSDMLNENNPAYQTTTPNPSTADNEQNNDGVLNHKLSHNHNINEKYAIDNIAISSSSSKFFAPAVNEKVEEFKEASFFQIQQPLFTTLPTLPNGVAPLISNEDNHQPVIKVHIGRIEIKAINQPPANDVQTKNSKVNKPAMSLDDYLKKEKRPVMSTALRIASVTYVLKDLLNNGLINHDVTGAIGETVAVTALPPDKFKPEEELTQLNLFMYQATYNSSWRNMAEPSVSNKGERNSNPPLAIDLHYLLSAYGSAELHTEILLGYGMQLMHENPVLGRDAIRTALAPPSNVPGNGLPSSLRMLSTSKLAEQAEMIKITPENLSIEDISKLWAAFGTRYRPTAAYKITVVLIESTKSTKAALPVKGRKIYVSPFKKPVIEAIVSQSAANQPILENQKILPGYRLVLKGNNLGSEVVEIHIDGTPLSSSPDIVIDDKQISFPVPANLDAGTHEVQVIHSNLMGSPPVPHSGVSSNVAVFVLSSVISNPEALNPIAAADASRSATIKFDINPAVSSNQKLSLYMNKINGRAKAYSFPVILSDASSPPDFFTKLEVKIQGVEQGNYLIRVQVDGAESDLKTDGTGKYNHPSVSIP